MIATAEVVAEAGDIAEAEADAGVAKKPSSSKPKDRLEVYIELMEAEDLYELEISDGPFQLKLVREPRPQLRPMAPVAAPFQAAEPTDEEPSSKNIELAQGTPILAPLGGVFYRSPSPKSPSYVKEGDTIVPGQTLGIIEAMKVMNEIKAEISGRITKILVENGKPVESNQTMFLVETE